MAEGKIHRQWDQFASLMALIANCNRDPEKRRRPFSPDDFNPFAELRKKVERATKRVKVGVEALKAFVRPMTGEQAAAQAKSE